ncbi:MAG: glycosyltransferase family 2 protein [Bacteroidetes bacterium]|nr:MAG: glycosyltransferase family 2 protein [Bacteroidota bacterium]
MQLSILIRNKNEAKQLKATLRALALQKTSFPYEVFILDNASTDHSLEVAREFGCRIGTVPKGAFSYGASLNTGIAACEGEIILLLSAHIILLNNDFLEQMVKCFSNSSIAFARPTNVGKAALVMDAQDGHSYTHLDVDSTISEQNEQLRRQWFTLLIANCSAVRRSVAIQFPFDPHIEANEDKLWSKSVLLAGYKGVHNLPCYYHYSKKNTPQQRLAIDFKELKTKAEILGDPYFTGTRIGFVFRSFVYACQMYWPRIASETALAINLAKLGRRSKIYNT